MRQIDYAQHAENQRQAGRDQEQQQAVLQAVEDLREEAGKGHLEFLGGVCI
jgi:hypothetical protein